MNRYTDFLRIATLPMPIAWGDSNANIAFVEQALSSLPEKTDIVVLPELFTTGYSDDPETMAELAERNTGDTVNTLRRWASRYGCAFAGSFLASTPPHYYNRGFIIEPNGDETFYDKRHLFSLSNEARMFAPGTTPPPVVRFRGWNISLIVCYDLRFPVWCRSRHNSYDLLLVVANWPKARGYAFEHLLIARAIENQCAVVGANRGGSDAYGDYSGLSFIFDCRGYSAGTPAGDTPWLTADLSRLQQEKFRSAFPVSADADDFNLTDRL